MILGPTVGYTDILDFEIEEQVKREAVERGARNPLRPSSAGYCLKRLAYDLAEFRGLAKWPGRALSSPQEYRLFELGHSVEFAALKTFRLCKVIQQRYKQQTLTFEYIERGDPALPKELLEGSCDFCFIHPEWKAIGDVKSKKDKFSQAFKTAWDEEIDWLSHFGSVERFTETAFWVEDLAAFIADLGDDFLTENLIQLNLYAHSDFVLMHGIDHAFLYRYNKNDSRHMEIRFRPSREVYDATIARFNAISIAVDRGRWEEVEKDFVLGSVRCAFCPHRSHCWPEHDALKEHFKALPKKNWPLDLHKAGPKAQEFLPPLFEEYEQALAVGEKKEQLEAKLLTFLTQAEIHRIRLDNGHIYDVKYKKTPRPHFELKRGKI